MTDTETKVRLERVKAEIEADPQTRSTYWETPLQPGYVAHLVVVCGCKPDCDREFVVKLKENC